MKRKLLVTTFWCWKCRKYKDIIGFFFDFNITKITAEKTNLRIPSTIAHLLTSKKFCEPNKYTLVKITDIIDLKALFGMMYFRGLLGSNHNSVESLFSDFESSFQIFARSSNVWSSSRKRREVKVRPFSCNQNCLGRFLRQLSRLRKVTSTLGEALYPMRHEIVFRKYNPNKLHHYGLFSNHLRIYMLSLST